MKKIFPSEILNLTIENHFYRFSKTSHAIYQGAIVFIIGIIVSLFFVKTEISVQSPGIIRSYSESLELTSPVFAEVLETNIYENKFVEKGDSLIWLNNEKMRERVIHLEKLILQNEEYLNDLKLISEFVPILRINTELCKSIYDKYLQKVAEYNLKINLLKRNYARTLLLFEKEVVSLVEKDEVKYHLEAAEEEKKIFIKQSKSEWKQLAVEYKLTNDNYKNEIVGLEKDLENYIIRSPSTGYVTNFSGIQPGSFVSLGQVIAGISPKDELISEYMIAPRNIGYLRNNMPAIFQIDAYNYNQWGLASGNIIDISNEVYIINNQPYFKVKCSLNERYLKLRNGFKGYLKKGLTTTARFQITERTIAQQLFDKADNWLNPKLNE